MSKSKQSGSAMVVLVAGAIALFVTGCSTSSQDELAETTAATGANSAISAETAPAVPKQASKSLPEGYPADVAPIYEGSKVTYASEMGSGMTLQYMVVVETGDSVDVVAKSLADHYNAQGVKVIQTPLNDEGVGQVVVSKDGYGIVITYSAGDKPDTSSISYNVKPQRRRD